MAIDFPGSPTTGDTVTSNSVEYIFDGTKWKLNSKKYSYTGANISNITNSATFDLSSGNFFTLNLSEQTTVSFTNPPASGIAQKFYVKLGIASGYEDTTVVSYDLENASYDNVSFSLHYLNSAGWGIFFKPDGTKMYVLNYTGSIKYTYQYSLSSAWDLSSASYDSVRSYIQDYNPRGIYFKPDGTKMYTVDDWTDRVFQYSLSSAWDLSTLSYDSVSLYVYSQSSTAQGLFFKSDGTKMYVLDNNYGKIHQYSLSSAWDLSSASYDSVSFTVTSNPREIFFRPDGTKVYVTDTTTDKVHQYSLSSAWDLSTASNDNVSFSVSNQSTAATGIYFKPDGDKMYIVETPNVYQYSTGSTTTSTTPVVTWPASVTWESGSAPTLPALGETDTLEFYTYDGGTTYYGKLAEDDIS